LFTIKRFCRELGIKRVIHLLIHLVLINQAGQSPRPFNPFKQPPPPIRFVQIYTNYNAPQVLNIITP
jgi:hypothetical protein